MQSVTLAPSDLCSAEHAAGLHAVFQPRSCGTCWPTGAPPLPAAPAPSPAPTPSAPPASCGGLTSLGEAIAQLRARGLAFRATVPDEPEPHEAHSPVDGGPLCATCGGWRKVRREDLQPGQEGFGQAVPCPDCRQLVTDQRVQRFWRDAGLPEDTEGLGLDTYPSRDPRQRQTLGHLRRYLDQDADAGKWLLLTGPVSVGKTVLGAAVARALIARLGRPATFQTAPKLLDRLRAAQRSDEGDSVDDLLTALERAPILLLDDLGAEALGRNGQSTEFVREKLFRLIDERKSRRLPTILTSNHGLEVLEQRLGDRIVDRIEQASIVVCVDGPNLRRRSEAA